MDCAGMNAPRDLFLPTMILITTKRGTSSKIVVASVYKRLDSHSHPRLSRSLTPMFEDTARQLMEMSKNLVRRLGLRLLVSADYWNRMACGSWGHYA
jgi:hypothetical protein